MNLANIKSLNWGGVQLKCMLFDDEPVWHIPGCVVILKQPETAYAPNGGVCTFSVVAIGAVSYEWQISGDGTKWNNINGYSGVSGAKTKEMTINPAGTWHTTQVYRCVVTGEDGTQAITDAVTMVRIALCVITKQPTDAIGGVGDTVTFTVDAENTTYYELQYSADGGATWTRLSSIGNGSTATPSATFSVAVTAENSLYMYRCELRDSSWFAAYTDTVKILSP